MCARFVERDLSPFSSSWTRIGARDVEQVGCFLGGHLGVDRDDAYGIALADFGQCIDEQTQGRYRYTDRK